jgi:hypothetical protein
MFTSFSLLICGVVLGLSAKNSNSTLVAGASSTAVNRSHYTLAVHRTILITQADHSIRRISVYSCSRPNTYYIRANCYNESWLGSYDTMSKAGFYLVEDQNLIGYVPYRKGLNSILAIFELGGSLCCAIY